MTFSGTMRVTVPAQVLVQELGGEAVFLNLDAGRYFGLDEVGTRMWQVLTSSPSIDAAIATLQSEYDVAPDKLTQDLHELVSKLIEQQLALVSNA